MIKFNRQILKKNKVPNMSDSAMVDLLKNNVEFLTRHNKNLTKEQEYKIDILNDLISALEAAGTVGKKERARQLAQNWQAQLDSPVLHSWQWCAEWSARFERIGRKYGLLREFKENGIL
jgi:hypothetical protein